MFVHKRLGREIPERFASPEALVLGGRAASLKRDITAEAGAPTCDACCVFGNDTGYGEFVAGMCADEKNERLFV
jgi:hypothetical protein